MDLQGPKPKRSNSIFDADRLLGHHDLQYSLGPVPPFAHRSNVPPCFTLLDRTTATGQAQRLLASATLSVASPPASSSRQDARRKRPRRSRPKDNAIPQPAPIVTPIISITPLASSPILRDGKGGGPCEEICVTPLSLVTNGRSHTDRRFQRAESSDQAGGDLQVSGDSDSSLTREQDSDGQPVRPRIKRPWKTCSRQVRTGGELGVSASVTLTPIGTSSPPMSAPLNLSLKSSSADDTDFRSAPSSTLDSWRDSRHNNRRPRHCLDRSSKDDLPGKRQRTDALLEPVAAHSGSRTTNACPGLDFGYIPEGWLGTPQLAHLHQGFDRFGTRGPNLTETLARLATCASTSPYSSPTTVITVSGTGPTKVISVQPATSRASRSEECRDEDGASISLMETRANGLVSDHFSKSSPVSGSSCDASSGSDVSDNSDCSSNQDSESGSSDSESAQGQSLDAVSGGGKRDRRGNRSGSQKRKRIMIADENELRIPIEHGWRRQTKIRTYSFSGARGEVIYFAPCGKKLKTYPEVIRYLDKHSITDLIRENFSFSAKHNIGEFLDPQEGGKYVLINEHEVLARIEEYRASKGRKYYYYQPAQQKGEQIRGEKHRRREEMKHQMRLEEQAAELRRQKEHLRFLKQQEKAERQEQIRAEKEMRTQQLLEELQKRRELLMMIDLERERRRQHMILVKALEVRKKQEEKERLKEEKNTEKRLIKEKKMEQKRLELQIIREMKKPVEDMELTDATTLPLLERIPGVRLAGKAFADILMVYEFIHNFGETLGFDMENLPALNTLQMALLNDEAAEEELVTILHHLLTCAIVDPGMPAGQKNTTMLGQSLKNVDITSGTVSEVLRIFIRAHEPKDGPMQKWIVDKPFMALNPTQKSTILAFLCNELLCSRNVCRQIDASIESVNGLRRDKWVVEGNIRKMRSVQMRKMVRLQNAKVNNRSSEKPSDESKCARSGTDNATVDSDNREKGSVNEGEEEEDAKNDSGNESDGSHRTAQGDVQDNEPEDDEEEPGLSPEEIEKKIERLSKQMNLFRRKLTKASQQLRALSFGQDRYKRRYWILPRVGGVLVEGMESGDFAQDLVTDAASDGVGKELENLGEKLDECIPLSVKNEAAVASDREHDLEPVSASTDCGAGPWCNLVPRVPCDGTTLRTKQEDHSADCSPGRSVFGDSVGASSASGRTTPCLVHSTPLPAVSDPGSRCKFEDAATSLSKSAFCSQHSPVACDESRERIEAKPIPKEFHRGWWRVADANQLRSTCQALHSRGIREKLLQKQLEKYLDIACEACNKPSEEALSLEITAMDKGSSVNEGEAPEEDDSQSWSYDTALRVDLAIVEQVEALEERVAGASMQVKSWKIPPKITEEDGIKFRPVCVAFEADEDEDEGSKMIMCPLDVAKERLLNLEAAIERRYLKPPLGHGAPEANVTSRPSIQQSCHGVNGEAEEAGLEDDSPPPPQDVAPGLLSWRSAVLACKTSSQLALCLNYLENTIAWDRSIMKASCQFCNSGDNEGMLLLCDGCDKGYHTYCFKPKMECIPDGDWFCYECVNKAAGDRDRVCVLCGKKGKNLCYCDGCPKALHIECMDPPLSRMPKNRWFCWHCAQKSGKSKGKSKKNDKSRDHGHVADKDDRKSSREQRNERKNKTVAVKDLAPCRVLLSEMESHEDAWPFLLPVNTKHFPTYRKIIKKPMDLNTVKTKIAEGQCKGREDFLKDVRQIFDNCETFNEDDSPVGKAGHNLRAYFECRWTELTAK